MEARLSIKITAYLKEFKSDIETKINDGIYGDELIEYIQTYDDFTLSEEDFQKRKRLKNMIPLCDRCSASRIDKTQCSRRRQPDQIFCGTHIKGQPYGVVHASSGVEEISLNRSQTVWCEDVNGIYYYIDHNGNVYNPEDIISNKQNPKIIATYVKVGDTYTIPSLFDK